jgi:hypothetical protein
VLEKAKTVDRQTRIFSCERGTDQLNGNCSKVVCYNIMRFPIRRPIMNPTNELLKTNTKASYRNRRIKVFLVKPKLSMMDTSLFWSMILALIEEERLKKQRVMATAVIRVKTFSRFYDLESCSC